MISIASLKADYISPTMRIDSYGGHQEWGMNCFPCPESTTIGNNTFYGTVDVQVSGSPQPAPLWTEIPYYDSNGDFIGEIDCYYRFKQTKVCWPDSNRNFEGVLVHISKVCFRFENPTDDISTAPGINDMLKISQYYIGTNIKYHFYPLENDNYSSNWWRNYVWGIDSALIPLYFVFPCSMRENLFYEENSSRVRMICWDECSVDCCIYMYLFQNIAEKYIINGVEKTCFNHWELRDRRHYPPDLCVDDQLLGCKSICSSDMFVFEIDNSYIKDTKNKTPDCPICYGMKKRIGEVIVDDDVSYIEVYDILGNRVKETKNFLLIKELNNGVYMLRMYSDEKQLLKTEKIVISK